MATDWIFELENKIFSIVEYRASKKLTKYKDINFVTTDKPVDTKTAFPTVYIHQTKGSEIGRDTEGETSAILYPMTIEVITNVSQNEANKVMAILFEEFSKLGFGLVGTPYYDNGANYYRQVINVRRAITNSDKF